MRISDWSSDVCSSDLEAFGQRPGADARGLEALYDGQHPLYIGERGTETLGQIQHGPEEIAGLVDLLDNLSGDNQVAVRQGGARLGQKMLLERDFGAGEAVIVGRLARCRAAGRQPVQSKTAVEAAHAVEIGREHV